MRTNEPQLLGPIGPLVLPPCRQTLTQASNQPSLEKQVVMLPKGISLTSARVGQRSPKMDSLVDETAEQSQSTCWTVSSSCSQPLQRGVSLNLILYRCFLNGQCPVWIPVMRRRFLLDIARQSIAVLLLGYFSSSLAS